MALRAAGRTAQVRLVKRIPAGAGLGGGSADAAAVLRWAGVDDLAVAASVGADVAFCLRGGRARVRGIGEVVEPLPFEDRTFTLLTPPFGCSTRAVYRAWDELRRTGRRDGANDLEAGGPRRRAAAGRVARPAGRRDGPEPAAGRQRQHVVRRGRVPRRRPSRHPHAAGDLTLGSYLPARRCQRVRFSIFLCFFLRMRLRRFLIREPMSASQPSGTPGDRTTSPASTFPALGALEQVDDERVRRRVRGPRRAGPPGGLPDPRLDRGRRGGGPGGPGPGLRPLVAGVGVPRALGGPGGHQPGPGPVAEGPVGPGVGVASTVDAGDTALRMDLVELLRGLPRRQREVVVLRYLADRSEQETADALGCSTGTVKQHAHRGLASLRSSLIDAPGGL